MKDEGSKLKPVDVIAANVGTQGVRRANTKDCHPEGA
jgi:hypothetical protein